MTRDQFTAALDRYGGDLSRWPSTVQDDAKQLVARDRSAATELGAAQRLDGLLAEIAEPASVDAALIGRIVSRDRSDRREKILQPTRRMAGWASAGIAATLMIGFVAGALVPADQSQDAIAALLFSGTEEDIGGELL